MGPSDKKSVWISRSQDIGSQVSGLLEGCEDLVFFQAIKINSIWVSFIWLTLLHSVCVYVCCLNSKNNIFSAALDIVLLKS